MKLEVGDAFAVIKLIRSSSKCCGCRARRRREERGVNKTSAASSHLKAFCANFQLWQSNSSISKNNCDNNNNKQNAKASSEQKFLWRKTTKIHLSTFKVCMCCSQLQQGDYPPPPLHLLVPSPPHPSFSPSPVQSIATLRPER